MPPSKPINVLVTGFGPYPDGQGGQHTTNASHETTKLLPTHLAPHSASNPTKHAIHILNPTAGASAYLPVEYAAIRSYVRDLHAHRDAATPVTLYLHLGQAASIDYVSVERVAFRQDMTSTWAGKAGYYLTPDNAGRTVADAGEAPWGALPMGLGTAVDVDALVERVRGLVADGATAVKGHLEPWSYCCGFLYYESLAQRVSRGDSANVLFVHVPPQTDGKSLKRVRDAVLGVVVAAVEQLA